MSHKTDFAAACAALYTARSILIITHVEPDGDAIGSLLGLGNALRAAGREVLCAVDGGVPDFLRFLPGAQDVRATLQEVRADLLICVDANREDRTGQVGLSGFAHCSTVINLDHHISNNGFGDIHLVLPEAASATEIVFNWLQELSLPLTPAVTQPLLTGLVTDTLGFRTSNVTAQTLQVALRLMESGLSLHNLVTRTLENRPYCELELWRRALQSLTLTDGVIAAQVSLEDSAQAGTEPGSDGDLVNQLRATNEARIAVVFRERAGGHVTISLRSKADYDVARVAQQLGGGGHAQAAGATIDGPLSAAQARVLPLLHEAVNTGNAAADA